MGTAGSMSWRRGPRSRTRKKRNSSIGGVERSYSSTGLDRGGQKAMSPPRISYAGR